MKSSFPLSALLLAGALALSAVPAVLAGAKKQSAATVRFHAEGNVEGGSFSEKVELLGSGRKTSIQSLALINEREIKAIYPFPARDASGTFGSYFKLDDHGQRLLSQHTMSRRGSYLFAYFNGRRVIDLYVDRAVNDGILCIPTGLTANDVSLLETSFPIIGQENVKPGKKKKTTPTPEKPKPTPKTAATPAPRATDPSLPRSLSPIGRSE